MTDWITDKLILLLTHFWWLTDWLTDPLRNWLTGWLTAWYWSELTERLIDLLTDAFNDWLTALLSDLVGLAGFWFFSIWRSIPFLVPFCQARTICVCPLGNRVRQGNALLGYVHSPVRASIHSISWAGAPERASEQASERKSVASEQANEGANGPIFYAWIS